MYNFCQYSFDQEKKMKQKKIGSDITETFVTSFFIRLQTKENISN